MKWKVLLFVLLLVIMSQPVTAEVLDSEVLVVYSNDAQVQDIQDLIVSCGYRPVLVAEWNYQSGMMDQYAKIVIMSERPLEDAVHLEKQVMVLGEYDMSSYGIETRNTLGQTSAVLSVYDLQQRILYRENRAYIVDTQGEFIGRQQMMGEEYPVGIITDDVLFAPYYSREDISIFAVAMMMNRYFDQPDSGKTMILIDEIYPFSDLTMLQQSAEIFHDHGIPFTLSLMPIYDNVDYPAFSRYTQLLRYIQSLGGSMIMHQPIVRTEEMENEELEDKMERAYAAYDEQDVILYDNNIRMFDISIDMIQNIEPIAYRDMAFPIDTVIRFPIFQERQTLNDTIDLINHKWLYIADYRQQHGKQIYSYKEGEIQNDFQYREKQVGSYKFLVDTGNQVLSIIVALSVLVIGSLTVIGYAIYRGKFIKRER